MTGTSSFHNSASSESLERGLFHIFTGEGKGKTSAALGIVLRAVGHGHRVHITFFMKGDYPYGEYRALTELPNVRFASFGGLGFIDPENIKPEDRDKAQQALATARQAMLSGDYDLVVLDEVNVAAAWKLVDIDDVIALVKGRPPDVDLIFTGRYADARLIQLADLVTECLKIKHPYDAGITARKGIDY